MDQSFQSLRDCKHSSRSSCPLRGLSGVSDKLPFFLVITIPVATPLGAIILGHLARGQVRQSGYIRSGSGIGSTGMVLGYLILSAYLCLAWILVIHPSWR